MNVDKLVQDFERLVTDLDERKLRMNMVVPLYEDQTRTYVDFNSGRLYGYHIGHGKYDTIRLEATPSNLLKLFRKYDKNSTLEEALVIANLRMERALKSALQLQ